MGRYKTDVVNESFRIYEEGANGTLKGDFMTAPAFCLGTAAAYADEFIGTAEDEGIDLDLTYATICNLPRVMNIVYGLCREQDAGNRESVNHVVNSLAAYMTFLALNEHRCSLAFGMFTEEDINNHPEFRYWINRFKINVGDTDSISRGQKPEEIQAISVDFMDKCYEAAEAGVAMKNGGRIAAKPIADAYLAVTGTDLRDFGFKDMTIGVPVYCN